MLAEVLHRVHELEQAGVEAAGVPISLLRFALAFFASVPVGILFKYVPTVKGRHVYAALTGFLLLYYPFGNGVFHLFVPSLLTYLAMHQIQEYSATLSWVISFAYLIACHVASASGAKWREGNVDFTGAMMVLALKLISAGVSYQDGLKKPEEMSPYQQAHVVRQLPSLLEWMSFIFAGGNLLAGPYFELSDYLAYIERRGSWDPKVTRQPSLAAQYEAGALRFVKALACLGAHFWAVQHLPVEALEAEWYHALSLPRKCGPNFHTWLMLRAVVMLLVSVIYRFRYYFAWAVSESALIFSGFCFNGWTDAANAKPGGSAKPGGGGAEASFPAKPKWDRYANTRIRHVEFSTSAAELPAHWNTCTGNFLRRYVYERLTPRGRKATFKTLLATQVVAGVWHGLFPGYALFFVTSAFMFESAKVIYRYEQGLSPRWDFLRTFPAWLFVKWAYTAFVLDYSASAFLLLEWSSSIAAWASVNFLGHFLMGAIILVSLVNPPRRPRKREALKEAAEKPQAYIKNTEPTFADVAAVTNGKPPPRPDEATWTPQDARELRKSQ